MLFFNIFTSFFPILILGLWGLIAAPLFRTDGLILRGSEESLNMLLWNSVGALVLSVFHAITSGILFIGLHKLDLFRVPASAEKQGLDILKHNEPAYGFGIVQFSQFARDD